MARATTVRFTDEMYARLDQASARTGMPVNSIVISACLEWMQRHTPDPVAPQPGALPLVPLPAAPRWATLRRALGQAVRLGPNTAYPLAGFTKNAQEMLVMANDEATRLGHPYIGTEHMLVAAFGEGFSSAQVLAALGIERRAVVEKIQSIIGTERSRARVGMVPTARVKKVIEIAFSLAGETGRVATHHILLALSHEADGLAAVVLNDLGASLSRIENEVESLKDPES